MELEPAIGTRASVLSGDYGAETEHNEHVTARALPLNSGREPLAEQLTLALSRCVEPSAARLENSALGKCDLNKSSSDSRPPALLAGALRQNRLRCASAMGGPENNSGAGSVVPETVPWAFGGRLPDGGLASEGRVEKRALAL